MDELAATPDSTLLILRDEVVSFYSGELSGVTDVLICLMRTAC